MKAKVKKVVNKVETTKYNKIRRLKKHLGTKKRGKLVFANDKKAVDKLYFLENLI